MLTETNQGSIYFTPSSRKSGEDGVYNGWLLNFFKYDKTVDFLKIVETPVVLYYGNLTCSLISSTIRSPGHRHVSVAIHYDVRHPSVL